MVVSVSDTQTTQIEPFDLLKAKLHRPRVTRDLLVRPRLLELLNRGLNDRLILVSAPAGFGKTTLISSWLDGMAAAGGEGTTLPAAWLSLDEYDGDLVLFLRYLIAALRTLFPGAGPETLALLHAPQQPPQERLFTTLNNEIEDLPSPFVLVLDDYHRLSGQPIHDFLSSLAQHWPRPLRLVLISRIDPPLPLPKLRASGKITEIRTADLRFNAEETSAYLDQVLEMPLSPQDRALLGRQTEGWITALRLATLSLHSAGQVRGLPASQAGAGKGISDYMQEEVLARQVPAIQMFLLRTSVLDRFCAPLCEAVVGSSDPAWSVRACLDWIARADLLIIPLDDRRGWYRYHSLFRDFLKEKLAERFGSEVVRGLHHKAAAWFAQQGILVEAVRHAQEGEDLELAASLIEQRLGDILNREDRATLEHLLSVLSEEIVQRRPWLLMAKAWALQPSWQLGPQSKVLSELESLLEEDGGATLSMDDLQLLREQVSVLQGQYAYLNNQPARCVACCEEALALLPRDWTYVRGGAKVYWGLGMGASGQGEAAERLLLDEYESLDDKTNGYALRTLQAVCFNGLSAGRLELARQTARMLLQQAIRGELSVLQGWAHFFLGLVAYQWNDLEAAGAHLAHVVDRRYLYQSLSVHHSMAGLALVHQARGERSEAWQVAEMLSSFQLEQRGHEEDEARSLRAGLMLDQGNREGAFRWADAFTAPVPDRPLFWVDVPHITRARILLARSGGDDVRLALHLLDELLDIAERTHNTRSKITILALRALALDALDRSVGAAQEHACDAQATLQQAVDLARPGGFLRPFVDLGPPMEALLGRLARLAAQSSAVEPIRRILAAFPGPGPGTVTVDTPALPEPRSRSAPGIPALVEPLTVRELEILTLLCEPVWPKEIARRLDISYLTVKRHTVNLYGKLGVNTRWDAVDRAIELGILPPR